MSKKEMLRELLEKMDEKEAGLLYCFAIGARAGSMEKAKNEKEGAKEHGNDSKCNGRYAGCK